MPPGSAIWAAQTEIPYGYTPTDLFLSDLFYAMTGQEHPENPRKGAIEAAESSRVKDTAAKLLAQQARMSAQSGSREV